MCSLTNILTSLLLLSINHYFNCIKFAVTSDRGCIGSSFSLCHKLNLEKSRILAVTSVDLNCFWRPANSNSIYYQQKLTSSQLCDCSVAKLILSAVPEINIEIKRNNWGAAIFKQFFFCPYSHHFALSCFTDPITPHHYPKTIQIFTIRLSLRNIKHIQYSKSYKHLISILAFFLRVTFKKQFRIFIFTHTRSF